MAIYHTGGAIYIEGAAITYAEASAMERFTELRCQVARRDGEIEAWHFAVERQLMFAVALVNCGKFRRASGWANPVDCDLAHARAMATTTLPRTTRHEGD